jgi:hypothetical protein
MNLLVHNLIERVPGASVNVFERERIAAIKKANASLVKLDISLGSYLGKVIDLTKLNPEIVSTSIGLPVTEFVKISNDEVFPQKIPHEVAAKIAHYFNLPFDTLASQLNALQKIVVTESYATSVHDLSLPYNRKDEILLKNKVTCGKEIPDQEKGKPKNFPRVSEEYLAKVSAALKEITDSTGKKVEENRIV